MFKPRQAAKALGRVILKSLRDEPSSWQSNKQAMLKHGVAIFQYPRFVRAFDMLVIEYKFEDVWMPFLLRLRIRRAYRQIIANHARHALLKPEVK